MTVPTALAIISLVLISNSSEARNRTRPRYSHYDNLFVARCEAKCWKEENKNLCVKSCLSKGAMKTGQCPAKNTTLSPFALVCIDSCKIDTECPGLTKCCQHSCGVTCQDPEGLLSSREVPEIPRELRVSEGRKKKTVYIEWKPGETTYLDKGGGTILYLVEERHLASRHFIEKRLSDWSTCFRTDKESFVLKHFVKPGRWYQFRVAAVNHFGTKGYSEPSLPYSTSLSPKPPKAPQNVTHGPLLYKNGSLSIELFWSPPISDLPLQKYKVFWSRRLHGAKALDSVLVHQQIISKDRTSFEFTNLLPNSLYFLQIQALVQYGKERLKGEKYGLVVNTTKYNTSEKTINNYLAANKIDDLHLEKLFWIQGDLRARIAWKSVKAMRFSITWWTGPCPQEYSNFNHYKLTATTKVPHFEIYNLRFSCRYRVSVREVSTDGVKSFQDMSVTFTTPSCNEFRMSHKKVKCIL